MLAEAKSIEKMTRWDVANEALEHHPEDADAAVEWALQFLDAHHTLKALLIAPLLRNEMQSCIDQCIRRSRQSFPPFTRERDYVAPDVPPEVSKAAHVTGYVSVTPEAEQRHQESITKTKAYMATKWLLFKLRNGKELGNAIDEEIEKDAIHYVKTGLTSLPRGLFLLKVKESLPNTKTTVRQAISRKKFSEDDLSRWFDEIHAQFVQSLQGQLPTLG